MTRRDVLQRIGLAIAAQDLVQAAPTQPVHTLPGTQPLTWDGDLAERMMDGAHKYVERIIAESVEARRKYWKRDLSSRAAYEKSVEPNRDRFLKTIGVVDSRVTAAMTIRRWLQRRTRMPSIRCAGRYSTESLAKACFWNPNGRQPAML